MPVSHEVIEALGSAGAIVAIAIVGALNHWKGNKREQKNGDSFDKYVGKHMAELRDANASAFGAVRTDIAVMRSEIKGVRADTEELKAEVRGLAQRERDRLEEKARRVTK